jgi:hypothetical protein
MIKCLKFSTVLLGLLLVGCGSDAPKIDTSQTIDVARILKQVNDAVENSIDHTDKDFPEITSVTLDLRVSVSSSVDASGKFPIALITAGGKVDKSTLHHINLTFAPTPPRVPADDAADKPKETRLGSAIRAVYKSVSHASDAYRFQHGSITLQCALRSEADFGANALGLVPIQADVSDTNDVVQSLTLNFGLDPTHTPVIQPTIPTPAAKP